MKYLGAACFWAEMLAAYFSHLQFELIHKIAMNLNRHFNSTRTRTRGPSWRYPPLNEIRKKKLKTNQITGRGEPPNKISSYYSTFSGRDSIRNSDLPRSTADPGVPPMPLPRAPQTDAADVTHSSGASDGSPRSLYGSRYTSCDKRFSG